MGQQDLAQEAVRANDREQNAMITKSAVAAIVTVATMGVGAPAAMGWAGTVAYGVGVGVATDAMGQGAALGLGYQDGWRWDETAFSGAGGGLGAAAGKGLGFGFRWAFGKGGVGRTAGPDGSRYSVAFETTLDPAVFSKGRGVHFNRANAALDAAMRSDDAFAWAMEGMMPGVGNRVSSAGGRKTPIGWTWHHAETHGVMQLVPRSQHTPGSIFWNTLHPGRRGGYSIWAIPAGAPRN